MAQTERAQNLEILHQTPERLSLSLKGAPKKLLLWTPSPGKWSIQEIVCHMRDMERDAYLVRYQRILNEENPLLKNIDGDAYALEKQYRRMKLGEVLKDWKRLRKENLKLLKKVKDDQWSRPGVHETDGPLTLEIILMRHANGNDRAHLGQIKHIKTRHEILQQFENGFKQVEAALRGVPEEVLRRKPSENKWSMMEIVAHLVFTEQFFLLRYGAMAYSERPTLVMFDNDEWTNTLKSNEQNLAEALKEWKRLRADTLTLLRALPQSAWQRTGIHPKRGEMTIESLAQLHSGHDERHAAQVRALRQRVRAT